MRSCKFQHRNLEIDCHIKQLLADSLATIPCLISRFLNIKISNLFVIFMPKCLGVIKIIFEHCCRNKLLEVWDLDGALGMVLLYRQVTHTPYPVPCGKCKHLLSIYCSPLWFF